MRRNPKSKGERWKAAQNGEILYILSLSHASGERRGRDLSTVGGNGGSSCSIDSDGDVCFFTLLSSSSDVFTSTVVVVSVRLFGDPREIQQD